jgi:hypothetical protein
MKKFINKIIMFFVLVFTITSVVYSNVTLRDWFYNLPFRDGIYKLYTSTATYNYLYEDTSGNLRYTGGLTLSSGTLSVPYLLVTGTSSFNGSTTFYSPITISTTTSQLQVKYDNDRITNYTHAGLSTVFGSVNNNLVLQVTGGNAAYGGISFLTDGSNTRMTILKDGNIGIATTSPSAKLEVAGIIKSSQTLVGANANFTDFPYAKLVSSQGDTTNTATGNIGVVGEAKSSGSDTASGVRGIGQTNGNYDARGIMGVAKVTAVSDSGQAVGAYGISTDTHTGAANIGVYASALYANTGSNYSFYGANGDIYNNGNVTFTGYLNISSASANGDISVYDLSNSTKAYITSASGGTNYFNEKVLIGTTTIALATEKLTVYNGNITTNYGIASSTAVINQSTITRIINPVSTTQVLYATNTISLGNANTVVVSSGGAVTLSSNPQISTTTAIVGEIIKINGSSDTNTITLVDGNGLKLNGDAPMTLGLDDVICLEYMSSGYWRENYRSNP